MYDTLYYTYIVIECACNEFKWKTTIAWEKVKENQTCSSHILMLLSFARWMLCSARSDYMFRVILKWQFKFSQLVLYIHNVWHNTKVSHVFFGNTFCIIGISHSSHCEWNEIVVWINFKSLWLLLFTIFQNRIIDYKCMTNRKCDEKFGAVKSLNTNRVDWEICCTLRWFSSSYFLYFFFLFIEKQWWTIMANSWTLNGYKNH